MPKGYRLLCFMMDLGLATQSLTVADGFEATQEIHTESK